MKLNINFMIKDGKKIISRDTKGYKVLLNRVTKEFGKIKQQKEIVIDVIIQMSVSAAYNNRGLNYRCNGKCHLGENKITIFYKNCDNFNHCLAVLGHEFGHLFEYNKDKYKFNKSTVAHQETFADKFSLRMTKIEKTPSITGKVRSIAAQNRSR